jgi:hypothetical protein
MIELTHNEATVIYLRSISGLRLNDSEIGEFLNLSTSYVKRLGRQGESKLKWSVVTRIHNRKLYKRREIASVFIRQGGGSVRELERLGITREDLYSEAAIIGVSEEDEHYQERFSGNIVDMDGACPQTYLGGNGYKNTGTGTVGSEGVYDDSWPSVQEQGEAGTEEESEEAYDKTGKET